MYRLLGVVVAVLAMVSSLVPGPPAAAEPNDGPREGSGYTLPFPTTGERWYGAYQVEGDTAYCVDLLSDSPRQASAWERVSAQGFHKQTARGDDGREAGPDSRATARELAEIAWVLSVTGTSPDAATGAAVEHFIRQRTVFGQAQSDREAVRWDVAVEKHPTVEEIHTGLVEQANRYAGPYQVELRWEVQPTAETPTGSVSVQVISGTGHAVPGVDLNVAAQGELETHDEANTGNDATSRFEVTLPSPDQEAVEGSLHVTAVGLPGTVPELLIPAENTVQRLMAAPPATEASANLNIRLEPTRYQPRIATQTRDVIAQPGMPAVDIVMLEDGKPGHEFSGTSTLHGPFETLDALREAEPEDRPEVGVASFAGRFDANGEATVMTSGDVTFPAPGYYSWVETLDNAPLMDPPEPPEWPQIPETSIVVLPELKSQLLADGIRSETSVVGVSLSDSLWITGVPGAAVPGSSEPLITLVHGRIAGPLAPIDGSCDAVDWGSAPTAAEYSQQLDGDQAHGLGDFSPQEPGCYSAEASAQLTHEGINVASATHPLGDPDQTVLIQAPTPEPAPSSPAETPGLPKTGAQK